MIFNLKRLVIRPSFLSLYISLEKVKYHRFLHKKLKENLPFISLVFGNPTIEEIQIQQAQLYRKCTKFSQYSHGHFTDFALKQFLKKDHYF